MKRASVTIVLLHVLTSIVIFICSTYLGIIKFWLNLTVWHCDDSDLPILLPCCMTDRPVIKSGMAQGQNIY